MAGDHQKALDAYRLAGEWRTVFALATQLQYSAGNITALAEELIGRYIEAMDSFLLSD